MSGNQDYEDHPQQFGDPFLLGIIRVLLNRHGGYAVIERHELRQGCLNPPLIIKQKNGDVTIHPDS